MQQIFTLLRKVFVPKYWEEIKIQFRSLTIISQDFVVPIYISTRGNTWRKYGNGDASSKAAFVKSSIQFGSMMLWRPSYFVSNTYHQAEASFKSKSQSVQSSSGMLVLRLLQGRMSVGGSARPRAWGNGATTGMSVCHGRRPSSQFGGTFIKDDLNPWLGRRTTWCPDFF